MMKSLLVHDAPEKMRMRMNALQDGVRADSPFFLLGG
jgi:hypothetical protein